MIAALLAVVWLHFLADFCLQTDKMARSKSTSWRWLTAHCLSYGVPFVIVFGWQFGMVNVAAHFAIDAVTSRATSRIFKSMLGVPDDVCEGCASPREAHPCPFGGYGGHLFQPDSPALARPNRMRYFFMVVGFDQALHYTVFVFSLAWLLVR